MADVDVFRAVRSQETDASESPTSSSTSDPREEFSSCISKSPMLSSGFELDFSKSLQMGPRQNIIPNTSKGEEMTSMSAPEHENIPQLELSRYGREPMDLIFGAEEDKFTRNPQPTIKIFPNTSRASENKGASINIKSIGDYDLGRTIGCGSTGKVKLATHRRTREMLAVKIIPRQQLDAQKKSGRETKESRERRVLREAAILNLIEHDNIVKLRDFLITEDYFCMFFDYVEGVQLLDYIINHKRLPEKQARAFFRQILSAVDYCHRNSIVHRDLKIENILVEEKTGELKLLDFGLSNFYSPDSSLQTFCGSLYFAAPELLTGTVYTGPEVDVWSLGVILYVLLAGKVPFDDKNLAALHAKIKACRLHVPEYIGDSCKELLTRMICRDPSLRATMDDVIFHPWVNQGYTQVPAYLAPERPPILNVDPQVLEFLQNEFGIQYSPENIRRILDLATHNWAAAFQHPIISLYFLAQDKLLLANGTVRTTTVRVDKERSRSLSFISNGDSSNNALSQSGKCRMMPIMESIPLQTRRSNSLCEPSTSVSTPSSSSRRPGGIPTDEADYLGIRTVYLKGFFSVNSITSRTPMAIRNELLQFFILHKLRYEDHRSYFVCRHQPSFIREARNKETSCGMVLFEVHIVRVAFVGMHGLHFKRLQGEITQYKTIVSQIINSLKL